jgi:hypothetical protein
VPGSTTTKTASSFLVLLSMASLQQSCIRLRTVGEGVGSLFAGNVWRVWKLAPRELYGVVPAYEYSYAESRVLTYVVDANPAPE